MRLACTLMDEAELLKWALRNGITDEPSATTPCVGHSLTVATFPQAGGRGLAAARDLKEGELILSVPQTALLNVDSFKEDAHFKEAMQLFPHLSPFQVLVALLLREVGKASLSRWFVYLKTLPRSYHTFAQFSNFGIQALQAEDAVWTAEDAIATAHKEWIETKPFLQTLGLKDRFVTLKAWQWACSTVSSRTLHVSWSSAGTLCPVGDLFNYAPPGNIHVEGINRTSYCNLSDTHVENLSSVEERDLVEGSELDIYEAGGDLHFTDRLTDGGYDTDSSSYCFYAREGYKKGDQVLLCYGLYTNLELLHHYGFILPYNPNDKVFMRLDNFSGFTPTLLPEQLTGLVKHGSMHIEVDGRPSFQLLAVLRLYFAPVEVRQHKGHLALSGQQLCIENDLILYQRLKETCSTLLKKFPSTMLMDSALGHIISLCSSFDGLIGLLDLIGNRESPCAAGHKLLLDSICGWSTLCANEQEQIFDELRRFSQHQSYNVRKRPSHKEQNLQMERWWLSINWRFLHKRIYHRCISHCGQQLLLLGRQKRK